jgi:hypothetical protein
MENWEKILYGVLIPASALYACLASTNVVSFGLPEWLALVLYLIPIAAGAVCYLFCLQVIGHYFYPGAKVNVNHCVEVIKFVFFPGTIVLNTCLIYFVVKILLGYGDETDDFALGLLRNIWIFQISFLSIFALVRLKFRIGPFSD